MSSAGPAGKRLVSAAIIAWLAAALFYFYQYVLRSAPSVMMPQLANGLGLTDTRLASLSGLFYYGYAPSALLAGIAMDQLGPRKVVPIAAVLVGMGAVLFGSGDVLSAQLGRLLQGVGGAFSIVSAIYIATSYFPPDRGASLVGATQMIGMAGGSAGQFLVGAAVTAGLAWNAFWIGAGLVGLLLAVLVFTLMPTEPAQRETEKSGLKQAAQAMMAVLRNPQSLICGLIAGLLFIPTNIFSMVWGVRFLEESHNLPYGAAVLRSTSVSVGWIIGCPLLGFLSDRIGRRKPVIVGGAGLLLASLVLILHGPTNLFPPYTLGLAAGIASGAAMIPYTVIKEANFASYSGTAAGVINFICFSLTAFLGPVLGGVLARASAGGERTLAHYQTAFEPLIYGVAAAIILTLLLRETGPRGAGTTTMTNQEIEHVQPGRPIARNP